MAHTGPPSFLQNQLPNVIPMQLIRNKTEHVVDLIRNNRDITEAGKVYNNIQREAELFLPKQDHIDCSRAWIEFELNLVTSGAVPTYVRASNGIWTMIRRVELKESEKTVQIIDHYNLLQSILYKFGSEPDADNYLGELYGIGTQSQRNAWGSIRRNYAIPIPWSSLTRELLNTTLHTGALKLRIIFDAPERWIECSNSPTVTQLDFEVRDLRLKFENLTTPVAYRRKIMDIHMSEGIKTIFDEFQLYSSVLDSSSGTVHLTPNKQCIKSLLTFFRDADTLNDPTVNDKFEDFKPYNLISYHHRFGTNYYQERPVQVDKYLPIESYMHYLTLFGHNNGNGNFTSCTKIRPSDFKTDSFLICIDLETAPSDPHLLNNVTTTHDANINIEFAFSVAPPINLQVSTFVHYQSIWQHGGHQNSIVLS